ncbi:hypothetical protein M404DRAFT_118732, partial [Pisolithus tinctorius Marx 270]
ELFHGVWKVLLDEESVEAYKNDIVVRCYDGVWLASLPTYPHLHSRLSREVWPCYSTHQQK